MARYECVRCKAVCHTTDPEHLCADIRKRYERNAKAVALVAEILGRHFGTPAALAHEKADEDVLHLIAAYEIVKALAGRDLGV